MKNARGSVLSLMLRLFAFLLTGANAVNLHRPPAAPLRAAHYPTGTTGGKPGGRRYASGINSGDNAWLLVSSALVLMMTAPGLILFYGGLVRGKNVLATMMHSLILMALVSMLWMIFGYSMAFAPGNAFVGNPLTYFMLRGVGGARRTRTTPATVPQQTLHAVPDDDVCHHHAGADQRRGGRTR